MFAKVVALSVLLLWLGLIGLGYAASDNLDTYIVPSITALDNQDYGDDVDSYRLLDLAVLSALIVVNLLEISFDPGFANFPKLSQDRGKPFEINCSFLL
jgi:hypothetical protein